MLFGVVYPLFKEGPVFSEIEALPALVPNLDKIGRSW